MLALYIHWPYCLSKCPYCDFNSHVSAHIDHTAFAKALEAELRFMASMTNKRALSSIFFGGGTPSLMQPQTVERLINTAQDLFGFEDDIEISMEANPTSVEAERFKAYAHAGVNRLSMGIQALDDDRLRSLGRTHSRAEAMAAFDIARAYFNRVSFDLIYAQAGQSAAGWEQELRQALSMAVDHLSLYQLTIEEGTRFFELHQRGKILCLPEEEAAELFLQTQEICEAAGLPAYEISNHARIGAQSRHNLAYWRYQDYIGVGPGAHGSFHDLTGARLHSETIKDPQAWLQSVRSRQNGICVQEVIPVEMQQRESLMMGLRLTEGVQLAQEPASLAWLQELGLVNYNRPQLSVTAKGRPVLNRILRELLV